MRGDETQRVTVRTQTRLYFLHVEGLRGLTALYVFLFHMRQFGIGNAAFTEIVRVTPFLGFGHYAVSIFIVISGYCLAAPLAHNPERRFDLREFAVRRFRRIYPAYAGALVLSVAAFFYWSTAEYHHVSPIRNIAIAFGTHALLLHNLIFKTAFYLNDPMWSVGAEAQIYLVFALLLVPLWKRYGVAWQLAAALVLGLIPHFAFHGRLDWTCPWFLGLFSMGVVAASLSERRNMMRAWRWGASAAVVLTLGIIVYWPVFENGVGDFGSFLPTDLLVGAALSIFLVAAVNGEGRLWLPARALAYAPLAWVGTFAYSIYLLHWVAIAVLLEALRRAKAGPAVSIAAYLLLIPVVLAGSYGFYRLLERPFMSRFLRRAMLETGSAEIPDPAAFIENAGPPVVVTL